MRFSIGYKMWSKKGWHKGIIGVKSKYSKTLKNGKVQIPNQYGMKEENKVHFLANEINASKVSELQSALQGKVEEIINVKP